MGVAAERAAEIKHAIADSEPKFVVDCVGDKAARLPKRGPGSGGCCASCPTGVNWRMRPHGFPVRRLAV
jgi:hypothetical protein